MTLIGYGQSLCSANEPIFSFLYHKSGNSSVIHYSILKFFWNYPLTFSKTRIILISYIIIMYNSRAASEWQTFQRGTPTIYVMEILQSCQNENALTIASTIAKHWSRTGKSSWRLPHEQTTSSNPARAWADQTLQLLPIWDDAEAIPDEVGNQLRDNGGYLWPINFYCSALVHQRALLSASFSYWLASFSDRGLSLRAFRGDSWSFEKLTMSS